MNTHWAILSLRETSDPITIVELHTDLTRRWAKAVCHFPAIKQGRLDRENPLSAYVFVQVPVATQLLERSPYASHWLRDPVSRKLLKVDDTALHAMVQPPALPTPGAMVKVTAGDYAGLEGTVVETNCQTVRVLVELWSRQNLLTLAANEFQTV